MNKIYILKGLPASGKSTWCKEQGEKNPNFKRVNQDLLREMTVFGKWNNSKEETVRKLKNQIIQMYISQEYDFAIDDTHLNPNTLRKVEEFCRQETQRQNKDYSIEIVTFDSDVDLCIERDLKRAKPVGADVIRDMYNKYIVGQVKYEEDKTLPHAIIVDIDGTVARNTSGRNIFDWSRCNEDSPIESVIELVETYAEMGKQIIFLTGRDYGRAFTETEKWLKTHLPKSCKNGVFLLMRRTGNNQKDTKEKSYLFDTHVKGKYYIDFALEDRTPVVNMWRTRYGFKVFQVEPLED